MKHIKLFEAFANKNISAIEKFLKLLDKEDSNNFVDFLKSVSEKTDIPLSNFDGKYVSTLKAIKMNVEGDYILKFWFSIENGFVGVTTTRSFTLQSGEDWMKSAFIQNFISNNFIIDDYLKQCRWTKKMYDKIIESQFALVVNITELSNGLEDLKSKRRENKKDALSFYSNDYIRQKNQQKRSDILQKKRGISTSEVRDKIYDIIKKFRCYDPMDLVDVCHELYFRKEISMQMFDEIMNDLEKHYAHRGDEFGRNKTKDIFRLGGGKFGGGFGRRRGYDYGYEYDGYI